jgi:hypothetical protein
MLEIHAHNIPFDSYSGAPAVFVHVRAQEPIKGPRRGENRFQLARVAESAERKHSHHDNVSSNRNSHQQPCDWYFSYGTAEDVFRVLGTLPGARSDGEDAAMPGNSLIGSDMI